MNTQLDQKLPIIGILGDGQLAMMMAQAYRRLGGQVFVFSAAENAPANDCADKVFYGEPTSFEAMKEFFEAVDIVTLENEFIDSQLLVTTSELCSTPLFPNPERFALIEDKLSEKRFFQELGFKLAEFFEVKSEYDLLDEPGYLKLAKGGYDGIGTYRVNNQEEAIEVYRKIKLSGVVLFEKAVDFQKELSMIGVSNGTQVVLYPMVETHQEYGTCRYVSFPSGVSEAVETEAKSQVERILNKLGTRGLFAFEYFLGNDNELILNESAPRPHNSGHITLDLNDCSQFENHMRAVAGMDLIVPEVLHESMMMVNLLGTQAGPFDAEKVCDDVNDPNSSVTLYNKTNSKIKRKMGHINLWGPNQEQRAKELVQRLEI